MGTNKERLRGRGGGEGAAALAQGGRVPRYGGALMWGGSHLGRRRAVAGGSGALGVGGRMSELCKGPCVWGAAHWRRGGVGKVGRPR